MLPLGGLTSPARVFLRARCLGRRWGPAGPKGVILLLREGQEVPLLLGQIDPVHVMTCFREASLPPRERTLAHLMMLNLHHEAVCVKQTDPRPILMGLGATTNLDKGRVRDQDLLVQKAYGTVDRLDALSVNVLEPAD